MTLKKFHFSGIFSFACLFEHIHGHCADKIGFNAWIMSNNISQTIQFLHTVHSWALEWSKSVPRESNFPLIITVIGNSQSFPMTLLQLSHNFSSNFPSVLLCWDPVTANPHLVLENWPKEGWGSRESLKCLSPKIWDWVFWHLDLFFIQFLNPNKVTQVKVTYPCKPKV